MKFLAALSLASFIVLGTLCILLYAPIVLLVPAGIILMVILWSMILLSTIFGLTMGILDCMDAGDKDIW